MPPTTAMSVTFNSGLVLIGFMGAGKSTVGEALHRHTGWPLVDLDGLIVQRQGLTIPEIFSKQGEEAFRRYETEALQSLVAKGPYILATGGGIVGRAENWPLMRKLGRLIYLRAEWATLKSRLAGCTGRPLAASEGSRRGLRDLLEQRRPLYEQADLIVDTDNRGVDEVVREILERIKEAE